MDKIPAQKYRFIPYRTQDIITLCEQMLCEADIDDARSFGTLATLLQNTFHFEFHELSEQLKASYAPLDPDRDTLNLFAKTNPPKEFISALKDVLEKANYEAISEHELNQALNESSLFKIQLAVDFDEYSEVLLFCRGISEKTETVKSFFGLKSSEVTFVNYDRVVVFLRFKTGSTILKLFQNVPQADLEMLFPNTRIEMRTLDKLLIGIPAAVSGGIILTTKLGASLLILGSLIGYYLGLHGEPVTLDKTALLALLGGLTAFAGYLWKQFNSFKNRKLKFMQALTENLYFKNLDNNAGVFHRLVNEAEDEEVKEAILAYCFLLLQSKPISKLELDHAIETYFLNEYQVAFDFEVDDALAKLQRLNLITGDMTSLQAVAIPQTLQILDELWDNYYTPKPSLLKD
jgi:hypothetical protein